MTRQAIKSYVEERKRSRKYSYYSRIDARGDHCILTIKKKRSTRLRVPPPPVACQSRDLVQEIIMRFL